MRQVRSALAELGAERFDYLVNNAGTGLHKPIADTTEEEFDQLMNVHLRGVFFLTQKLLPLIADGGRIINLSSGLARFSMPGTAAYAMMKGGSRSSRARWRRSSAPAGSRPTRSRRARSRPTSTAVVRATTPTSIA